MSYSRRNHSVEAIKFAGSNLFEVMEFIGKSGTKEVPMECHFTPDRIEQGRDGIAVNRGSWILFEDGRFSALSDQDFERIYHQNAEAFEEPCKACGR